MSENIKILVVDDAVLARKVLNDVISEEPGMEVAAATTNGRLAMQRFPLVSPDVVVLDFEMPEMDGLATIDAIRRLNSTIPIVMFSAITERGARQTLEALSRGANDYVTKPTGVSNLEMAKAHIRTELLPKIRALCPQKDRKPLTTPRATTSPVKAMELPRTSINVVSIGVSTGGPNALAELIPMLPKEISVPILITQHMPPMFTKMLAERLTQRRGIPVHEASEGMPVLPGNAYIAPGGFHMVIRDFAGKAVIALNQDPPENSCRPAVDVMLRSIVNHYGANVLSLILTGMGQDGMRGCDQVVQAGGIVMVQDEATSVVWGMPGAVSQAGLAHLVVPLKECASTIVKLIERGLTFRANTNSPL